MVDLTRGVVAFCIYIFCIILFSGWENSAKLDYILVLELEDRDSTLQWRAPSASDHGFTSRGDEARKQTKNDEELNSLEVGSRIV